MDGVQRFSSQEQRDDITAIVAKFRATDDASLIPSGTTIVLNDTAPTSDRYNLGVVEVVPANQ